MFVIEHYRRLIKISEILKNTLTKSALSKKNFENINVINNVFKSTNLCLPRPYCTKSTPSDESKSKEIDFSAICNGDKTLEHKLKVIRLETEVLRQEGKIVPPDSFFTNEHWAELLKLPSRSGRKKYMEFLFKISKKKENQLDKKIKKRQEFEESRVSKTDDTPETLEAFASNYSLQHNNMLLRVYDSTINQLYNNRLIQAMMFGQKLVVDCGYETNMTKRENYNAAKQLMLLFADNRAHDDPFDLHYCNTVNEGDMMKKLLKYIPTLNDIEFPLNVTEKSYMDIFPKEKLVYLTPHCREELTEYGHDDIYIVGAIVDKVNNEPLSLAKAKREGLRMAKFPLDRYLQWSGGSGKSLTLNQVVSILNDVKVTGNWEYALRHVPKRKIVDYNIGQNITKATNNLRFDKQHKRPQKWRASTDIDIDTLNVTKSYNKDEKKPKLQIKTIMQE